MKDLYNKIAVAQMLDAQVITNYTDVDGPGLDLQGFESVVVAVNFGACAGTDGSNYILPVLEEYSGAAAGGHLVTGNYTAVAAADLQGAFTAVDGASDDQKTQVVGYIGSCRYIRVKLDFTGTGVSSCAVASSAFLSDGRHGPESGSAPTVAAMTS